MKHSHYKQPIEHLKVMDIYRFLELLDVTCPVAQHVIKKAAKAGQRGHKSLETDWQNIIDSAERKLEMMEEDAAGCANKHATRHPMTPGYVEFPGDERIDQIGRNGNDGEHYAEDMTDPANWRAGDLVECVNGSTGDPRGYHAGRLYMIRDVSETSESLTTMLDSNNSATNGWLTCNFRFHSRPSQVNESEMSGIWHHWAGGECPCDGLSMVECEYRDGLKDTGEADGFYWPHDDTACDIIRYRML